MYSRNQILIVSMVFLLFLAAGSVVYAQLPGITLQEITIKGEVQEPQSIISPSRTRPEFIPAAIDSVGKDYTESAFALMSDLIAPAQEEVRPKKMSDFKSLIAKERH
ncbi:MAG: hypothetical protein P9L92_08455 [Candidatus Electryonea clarkiae]|nr:hypothetical protein [Candidatus Electryonea clarkiae]MDP8286264.1 hypothetical protein [Candidatus Electryonea clarkiae]